MSLHKGKIVEFRGSWMSGLGSLVFEDNVVHCENAPTVRALEGCFGNVIAPGHSVDPEGGHVGKEVYYSVDAFGVLEGFTPVEDASDELVAAYRKERRRGKGKVA